MDSDPLGESDGEDDSDSDPRLGPEGDELSLRDSERDPLVLGVREGEIDALSLTDSERDSEVLGLWDGLSDALWLGERLGLRLGDSLSDRLPEVEGLNDELALSERLPL